MDQNDGFIFQTTDGHQKGQKHITTEAKPSCKLAAWCIRDEGHLHLGQYVIFPDLVFPELACDEEVQETVVL